MVSLDLESRSLDELRRDCVSVTNSNRFLVSCSTGRIYVEDEKPWYISLKAKMVFDYMKRDVVFWNRDFISLN